MAEETETRRYFTAKVEMVEESEESDVVTEYRVLVSANGEGDTAEEAFDRAVGNIAAALSSSDHPVPPAEGGF